MQEKLTALSVAQQLPNAKQPNPLEQVNNQQNLLRQKMAKEVAAEQRLAEDQSKRDPRGALARLEALRARVQQAKIDTSGRKHLLTIVDRNIHSLQQYMKDNVTDIELRERNAAIAAKITNDRDRTEQIDNEFGTAG